MPYIKNGKFTVELGLVKGALLIEHLSKREARAVARQVIAAWEGARSAEIDGERMLLVTVESSDGRLFAFDPHAVNDVSMSEESDYQELDEDDAANRETVVEELKSVLG